MSIGIKIPFFRVSVTIELGCFLLTVLYHELFDWRFIQWVKADLFKMEVDDTITFAVIQNTMCFMLCNTKIHAPPI